MSEIRLKNGQDEDARRKLDQIMKELSSDPVFGILEVLDRAQAIERGGFPLADYVAGFPEGYEIRDDAEGDTVRKHCIRKPSMVIVNDLRR